MGGGGQQLQASPKTSDKDPVSDKGCTRSDGKDLIKQWQESKKKKGHVAVVVRNDAQLRKVDTANTDYLLGVFANDHMPFEALRDKSSVPSLANMTHTALRMLNKNKNGYLLLVEGGRIDHGHHKNKPQLALEETLQFDIAIEAALGFVDTRDTLVIVTADHSHGMAMIGYPRRGNPILEMAGTDNDSLPYSTLLYGSGPGGDDSYSIKNGKASRNDLSGVNTSDPTYTSQALVGLNGGAHAGEDVMVYAKGPMSFMFHRAHEQNYIGHVISFAMCIGPVPAEFCELRPSGSHRDAADACCVIFCLVIWTCIMNFIKTT